MRFGSQLQLGRNFPDFKMSLGILQCQCSKGDSACKFRPETPTVWRDRRSRAWARRWAADRLAGSGCHLAGSCAAAAGGLQTRRTLADAPVTPVPQIQLEVQSAVGSGRSDYGRSVPFTDWDGLHGGPRRNITLTPRTPRTANSGWRHGQCGLVAGRRTKFRGQVAGGAKLAVNPAELARG